MSLKQTKIWKFLSSIKLAIWLLAVIALLSLIGTFIPQTGEPDFYTSRFGTYGYQALLKTGLTDVYHSWWFILSLVLFSLNLTVCFLNRFSLRAGALGTLVSHASVLVILLGALVGMLFGENGYVKINKGEQVSSFISRGRAVNLEFSLRLDDFIYSENIDAKEKLLIYSGQKDAACELHSPNSAQPNPSGGLVAAVSTQIGSQAEIADTGYKLKVLRYVSDFMMDVATKEVVSRSAMPNNPALEVELRSQEGAAEKFWVFARYPDIHKVKNCDLSFVYNWVGRRPKDFISKVTVLKDGREGPSQDIRVNSPLEFKGYNFYQVGYDTERLNWTALKVVRDPGVGLVYLGFGLLILGLILRFYVNPLLKNK